MALAKISARRWMQCMVVLLENETKNANSLLLWRVRVTMLYVWTVNAVFLYFLRRRRFLFFFFHKFASVVRRNYVCNKTNIKGSKRWTKNLHILIYLNFSLRRILRAKCRFRKIKDIVVVANGAGYPDRVLLARVRWNTLIPLSATR